MTTIVGSFKHKMMAADSKCTLDKIGVSYPVTKIMRINDGEIIGACGHGGNCQRILEWAKNGWKNKPEFEKKQKDECDCGNYEVDALVLRKDGLYFFSPDCPEPEKMDTDMFAIGSGGKTARAVMKLGYDPIFAVKVACKVDDFSGLPVKVLRLK